MRKKSKVSLTKGYTFTFEDDGNTIEAWFSALSGLEKVHVNGSLVSSQRNFSTDSTNRFNIGPNEYSTNLKIVSFLKGPYVCTLSKNGEAYKRQNLVCPKAKPASRGLPFVVKLLFFVILGALMGFARAYWQLPTEANYIFIFLLFVVVFVYCYKSHNVTDPVIEDEEIL